MWHLTGTFEPSPDFAHYEQAIASVQALYAATESDEHADRLDAQEIVDGFGFVAEWANGDVERIRDFQFDGVSYAEFKTW